MASVGKSATPAPGSDDPADGDFGTGCTVNCGSGTTQTIVQQDFVSGGTMTQTVSPGTDPTYTISTSHTQGSTSSTPPPPKGGPEKGAPTASRLSWKSLIRP
jgi:hypothetical protein